MMLHSAWIVMILLFWRAHRTEVLWRSSIAIHDYILLHIFHTYQCEHIPFTCFTMA